MGLRHLFRSRRQVRRSARSRRAAGSWESLGLGLGAPERLEGRALMAADLLVSLDDNLVEGVERSFAVPGQQIVYSLVIENTTITTASGVAVNVTLPDGITGSSWFATYAGGGATGTSSGAGDVAATITLPAFATARFTILARVGHDAQGDLTTTAKVVNGSQTLTASDTDLVVPPSLVASDDVGVGSSSAVRLINQRTGTEIARALAFEQTFKTGVRTAVGDLDGDGSPEIVAVPSYGRAAEVVVFRQRQVGAGWQLEKIALPSLAPFGAGYDRGLNLAVGDFTGDGRADIAVAKATGSGEVKVYESKAGLAFSEYRSFTPIAGSRFGVTLAAGDFGTFPATGTADPSRPDGRDELVVGGGPGATSVVQIHNLASATAPVLDTIVPFASAENYRGGATVTTARVGPDAIADLVISQGRGGTSLVEIYDGAVAAAANPRLASVAAFASQPRSSAPVFASAVDVDGDGRADRLDAVQGGAGRGNLRRFTITPAATGSTVTLVPVTGAALPTIAGVARIATAAARPELTLVTTASGLQYRDLRVGTGASPSSDSARVTVNYAGKLLDGTQFDARNGLGFDLNRVIRGWTEGLRSMRVGGRRQLIVPANLGYGSEGNPPDVPPNATLVFDVELLATT